MWAGISSHKNHEPGTVTIITHGFGFVIKGIHAVLALIHAFAQIIFRLDYVIAFYPGFHGKVCLAQIFTYRIAGYTRMTSNSLNRITLLAELFDLFVVLVTFFAGSRFSRTCGNCTCDTSGSLQSWGLLPLQGIIGEGWLERGVFSSSPFCWLNSWAASLIRGRSESSNFSRFADKFLSKCHQSVTWILAGQAVVMALA